MKTTYNKGQTGVWVIVAVVVIAVLLLIFVGGNDESADNTASSTPDATTTQQVTATNENIQAAVSGDSNSAIECSFSNESGGAVTYIKDGKLRTIAESDDATTTNMIYVDGLTYVWQQGETEGYTFDQATYESQVEGRLVARPSDLSDGVPAGGSCFVSDVSDSLFELPESVAFKTYSEADASAESDSSGMMEEQ